MSEHINQWKPTESILFDLNPVVLSKGAAGGCHSLSTASDLPRPVRRSRASLWLRSLCFKDTLTVERLGSLKALCWRRSAGASPAYPAPLKKRVHFDFDFDLLVFADKVVLCMHVKAHASSTLEGSLWRNTDSHKQVLTCICCYMRWHSRLLINLGVDWCVWALKSVRVPTWYDVHGFWG